MYSNEFTKKIREMFKSSAEKKSRGFVLIYTIFITTLCFILVQAIFSIEFMNKVNSDNKARAVSKTHVYDKDREIIFTKLDEYIHKNVKNIDEENVKNHFLSNAEFKLEYKKSGAYIQYYNYKNKNCFLAVYLLNGRFYKKELYRYKVKNDVVVYGCVDYSFEEEKKFD